MAREKKVDTGILIELVQNNDFKNHSEIIEKYNENREKSKHITQSTLSRTLNKEKIRLNESGFYTVSNESAEKQGREDFLKILKRTTYRQMKLLTSDEIKFGLIETKPNYNTLLAQEITERYSEYITVAFPVSGNYVIVYYPTSDSEKIELVFSEMYLKRNH